MVLYIIPIMHNLSLSITINGFKFKVYNKLVYTANFRYPRPLICSHILIMAGMN